MLLGFAATFARSTPAPLAVSMARPAPVLDAQTAAEVAAAMPVVRVVAAAVLAVGRDHADVDDVASETMRRAVEGHERLRPGDPVRPWVIGIARHVALDARRSRGRALRRNAEPPGATPELSAAEQVASPKPDPFEQLARARRDSQVREALEQLPEGSRQALTLFHLEELGYEEIAAKLGVPMGTVATWISRGRKALQGTLSEEGCTP